MAPQYMPLPLLDNAYAAVSTANTTFDSPDWKWSRGHAILDSEYVPYIQTTDAIYEAAVEREFADWRSEWELKFPDLFIGHAICTICLDPIGDQEIIRGLPCLHVFHKGCMDTWLEALHVTCPLCKQDILKSPSPCYRPGSEQV
ncbi:hypothetical protein E4T44_07986 [Aureobasidium sp. EXF-8845]|nr:hypothetical protein E4T44_07986 [Aureobasidium sp. EXF-8845]KAI4845728.1 hypothetical protein E4T45_07573 [Aureobasidium sp. EXF-8846]